MKNVVESGKKKKKVTNVAAAAAAASGKAGKRQQIRDAFSKNPGMKESIGGQLNTRRKKTEAMMKELDKR
jgi:hypothetical protein